MKNNIYKVIGTILVVSLVFLNFYCLIELDKNDKVIIDQNNNIIKLNIIAVEQNKQIMRQNQALHEAQKFLFKTLGGKWT